MRSKIVGVINLLEEFGVALRMPYSEYLGGGIFQLRIQAEGNAARVLYFFVEGERAYLTNGFLKKTVRTPAEELATAKRYRAEFLNRQG